MPPSNTSIQGLSFNRFAPKAATEEHLPPFAMKERVSRMKLASTLGIISSSRVLTISGALMPAAAISQAASTLWPMPVERFLESTT